MLALGSLAVLLDAGAKYSADVRRLAAATSERALTGVEEASSDYAPHPFRLATLSLDGSRGRCMRDGRRAGEASQTGDDSFDINCAGGATVNRVGDLPRAESQSWPGDSRYDRAVRF